MQVETFWEGVQQAYDQFCREFVVRPGRLVYLGNHNFLMTGCGFDLEVTCEEPITRERVEAANKLLSPQKLIMRRPSVGSRKEEQ